MSAWEVPEGQLAAGRIPGFVGALRIGEQTEVRCAGTMALDGPPMREDTLFRIASLTKPVGGALLQLLIADGVLSLDDPVSTWLPELAEPWVLTAPDAPLDSTVACARPITVRHLVTFTFGLGAIFARTPLQRAMLAAGVYPGPLPPPMSNDEFVAQVAALPLMFQPGEGWLYDTGMEVLGVLLARACGKPLSSIVAERITGPLGMTDTAFWAVDVERLATQYMPRDGGLAVLDPPDGAFATPGRFEMLGGGLVSTAGDMLRFFDSGLVGPEMLVDTLEHREMAAPIVGSGSWAVGTGIWGDRWGWDGGTGCTGRAGPDFAGVLLTQRAMTGPQDGFEDFWALV